MESQGFFSFITRVAQFIRAGIPSANSKRVRRCYLEALHKHVMTADTQAMAAVLGTSAVAADVDAEVRRQVLALLDRAGCGASAADPLRVMMSPIGGNGGRGVFAAADIAAGRVISLYPGQVYTAQQLMELGGSAAIDPHGENEYLFFRTRDGVCYDASPAAMQRQALLQHDFAVPVRARAQAVHLGLGHLMNHGPPNVLAWGCDLTVPEAVQHSAIIPNHESGASSSAATVASAAVEYSGGTPGTAVPPRTLLALVTLCDLAAGEELLLDYRLEFGMDERDIAAGIGLPSWYIAVPCLDATRPRWTQQGH
eukprot:g2352.t1